MTGTRYHTWSCGCDTDGTRESPASVGTQLWRGAAVAFAKSPWRRRRQARAGCRALREHQPNPSLSVRARARKQSVKSGEQNEGKQAPQVLSGVSGRDTQGRFAETPHQGSKLSSGFAVLHGPLHCPRESPLPNHGGARERSGPAERHQKTVADRSLLRIFTIMAVLGPVLASLARVSVSAGGFSKALGASAGRCARWILKVLRWSLRWSLKLAW